LEQSFTARPPWLPATGTFVFILLEFSTVLLLIYAVSVLSINIGTFLTVDLFLSNVFYLRTDVAEKYLAFPLLDEL